MHALFFALKRTHHRVLAFGRTLFRNVGLTPARFDMLHAIRESARTGPLTQRALRDVLGVTAPTVSRMAASLEDLGLVTRRRNPSDRRHVLIELTVLGTYLFTEAMRIAVGSGAVDLVIDCAFTTKWYAQSRFKQLFALDDTLERARDHLRDRATLQYPFRPNRASRRRQPLQLTFG
jgi:DNA-binding MarR family transcriptional regulator